MSRIGHITAIAIVIMSATTINASALATTPTDRLLDEPTNGPAALRELGGQIAQIAQKNGLDTDELRSVLRNDETAWIDTTGRLLYIDTALPRDEPAPQAEEGPYPYSETFALHSSPGALRTIYLDFNGHVVTGTAWNNNYGVSTGTQPPFDLDGDPSSFSANEQDAVQSIWQRVSEDYAPLDVDVTTEEPALERINRSSSADQEFGTRVLITPSTQAQQAICPGGCGGVAYLGVYDYASSHSYYQPAWVFSHMLSNGTKYIAEAVSHEAGHNLGLQHDGLTTGSAYYQGHGSWAPIMGVGYYQPIVQWSAGEYTGANNSEDDFAVIAGNGLGIRVDDHGDGLSTATPLGSTQTRTGTIATRVDKDYFSVNRTCVGAFTASASASAVGPNLDVSLRSPEVVPGRLLKFMLG